ncbi:22912_t:CDS:2 [Entrophospora sp. SA101]|nr:1359_t:CDS:2 [Entrophospora sp. SA101]CAJ0769506.1 22912_t:CDS:2 [Entrophospora sp. SA101]
MALQLGGQKTFKNVQYQPSNGPHDTKLTFSPSRNDTDNTYIVYISNEEYSTGSCLNTNSYLRHRKNQRGRKYGYAIERNTS